MPTVNDRFRFVIEQSGLSQKDFAAKIKRNRGEIANIVYDKTNPKDNIIEAVCEVFDIQEDWLRYGLEPMRAPRSREEEISELVGSTLRGSNEFKKSVVRMICSRTEEELRVLESAIRTIYEDIQKEEDRE